MKVYQVEQLAELMGCTTRWVRMMLGSGELPGRKIGRRWWISEDALRAYLGGKVTKESSNVDQENPPAGDDKWVINRVEETSSMSPPKSRIERLVDGEEVEDE